jgi:hypothetical protein
MLYYALINKETGKMVRDKNNNLITFVEEPKPTFNYFSIELTQEEVEKEFNIKLDNYGL